MTARTDAAALAAVRKVARRKRRQLIGTPEAVLLPTHAEVEQAAALLADLWAAGRRYGISPAAWALYIDLPQVALHAASVIHRTTRAAELDRHQAASAQEVSA